MSKTLANLRDEVSKIMGDYLHSTVTTALAASTSVVDTALANVKGGTTNDYFNYWYCLITSLANAGANRIVSDYVGGTTTLTVQGANFTSDVAAKATYELHRIDPTLKLRAINSVAQRLYPEMHRKVTNRTLITNNILPNSHFEDWVLSSSYPDLYAVTNATAAANTTTYRGGGKSANVAATAANGYMYISSAEYPRLLDLAGQTISFYAWAYPEVADDAALVIYTLKADSTAQTLTSTTSSYAGKWNLISLENQAINSDIVSIAFRFKVITNAKYVYWDNARVVPKAIYDYVLPHNFYDGEVNWVRIQQGNVHDHACDDIGNDVSYSDLFGWETYRDGAYKYLKLPFQYQSERLIEVTGTAPLEDTLSSDTDTMTIDDPFTKYFCTAVAREAYVMSRGQLSSGSSDYIEKEIMRLDMDLMRLGNLKMVKPKQMMRLRNA